MKREAYIWRESVYKNGFNCNCGKSLADESGYPHGDTLYDTKNDLIVCPACGLVVAKVKIIDAPADLPSGLQGDWSEYERSQLS